MQSSRLIAQAGRCRPTPEARICRGFGKVLQKYEVASV